MGSGWIMNGVRAVGPKKENTVRYGYKMQQRSHGLQIADASSIILRHGTSTGKVRLS
jgi:hypothetical protein